MLKIMRAYSMQAYPYGNVLPASYEAALKLIEPYLIDSIVFHSCPNDCVVFRGKYAELYVGAFAY